MSDSIQSFRINLEPIRAYRGPIAQTKGQLISKADWRAMDSPKKRTDEFVLFAFLLFTAIKLNLSVHFLEKSTVHQSDFRFYLIFTLFEHLIT